MVKRVYVDSSVIGGVKDAEFADDSKKLMDEFQLGLYIPVISKVTSEEIEGAPLEVLAIYDDLLDVAEHVDVSAEAVELSLRYMKDGKFTQRMANDTLHIAIASVNKIDVLVSWNFRDIVNLNKIVIYNSVNIKLGYPIVEIRSPKEILHG